MKIPQLECKLFSETAHLAPAMQLLKGGGIRVLNVELVRAICIIFANTHSSFFNIHGNLH
jgi:hypothetical protein